MNIQKRIAVIPARGGSKRIPHKNIKLFAGKPLIAYSLLAAKKSGVFDDIVVSTDDSSIADIALQHGASKIIRRPDSLADDFTGTSPVVRHAINEYEKQAGSVNLVCCIYATAPFLSEDSLTRGLRALHENALANYAFSVTSFPFPIQRALKVEEGVLSPVNREMMGKRSQDLPDRFHDAGQFYWGHKTAWLERIPMFHSTSVPVILPRYLVQDIDTLEDWQRAELMFKAYVSTR